MSLRVKFKISPKSDCVKVEFTDKTGIGLTSFDISIPEFMNAVSSAQTVANLLRATGRLK